jgi:hypothetical protein
MHFVQLAGRALMPVNYFFYLPQVNSATLCITRTVRCISVAPPQENNLTDWYSVLKWLTDAIEKNVQDNTRV